MLQFSYLQVVSYKLLICEVANLQFANLQVAYLQAPIYKLQNYKLPINMLQILKYAKLQPDNLQVELSFEEWAPSPIYKRDSI